MSEDAGAYGEAWAQVYDRLYADRLDTESAVERLVALAPGGRMLELGVGTGRLALPLAAAGFAVTGVDASPAMLARLRAKPGADRITVIEADMIDPPVDGTFDLVVCAFNTLFLLPNQDSQVRCVAGAARLLAPDGALVVEAFVPDPARFESGQVLRADEVADDRVVLEATRHDPVAQTVRSARVVVGEQGIQVLPMVLRYCWPAELDLMARLAGLWRHERWGGWDGSPFGATSAGHVSVYRRAAAER